MKAHPSADEICLARLQLRSDLRCTLQSVGGAPYYLIEDPLSGRFFRFGRKEWEWASRLDGRRTVRELHVEAAHDEVPCGLEPQDQQRLCRWLLQMQLVTVAGEAVRAGCNRSGRVNRRLPGGGTCSSFASRSSIPIAGSPDVCLGWPGR